VGLNKKYININQTLNAVNNRQLDLLYNKTEVFVFEADGSSDIFKLYTKGISYPEIISYLKNNNYEVY
jgi:hypothetical protein